MRPHPILRHAGLAMLLFPGTLILKAADRGTVSARAPKTHVVLMLTGSFEPRETQVRGGDTVRFVNRQGGPHNVEFVGDSLPSAAKALLDRAMPGGKIGPLSGPLLIDEDETWSIVVPDQLASGRYAYLCLPHQAYMRGSLVVAP